MLLRSTLFLVVMAGTGNTQGVGHFYLPTDELPSEGLFGICKKQVPPPCTQADPPPF